MDGGNAIGLSGTILAHALATYDRYEWWKCRKYTTLRMEDDCMDVISGVGSRTETEVGRSRELKPRSTID